MAPGFLAGDRPFTVSLIDGSQLPLTGWRLPAVKQPARGDVIMFANPRYPENHEVNLKRYLAQAICKVTFTPVNIDRTTASSEEKSDPLVRRVVGVPGEKLMMVGDVLYERTAADAEFKSVAADAARYSQADLWKLPESVRARLKTIPIDGRIRSALEIWDTRKNGADPGTLALGCSRSARAAMTEFATAGARSSAGPTAYERGSRALNLLMEANLVARLDRDVALVAARSGIEAISADTKRAGLIAEARELALYLALYDMRNSPEFPAGDSYLGFEQYFAAEALHRRVRPAADLASLPHRDHSLGGCRRGSIPLGRRPLLLTGTRSTIIESSPSFPEATHRGAAGSFRDCGGGRPIRRRSMNKRENWLRLIRNEAPGWIGTPWEAFKGNTFADIFAADPVTTAQRGNPVEGTPYRDAWGTTWLLQSGAIATTPYITDENKALKNVRKWSTTVVFPRLDGYDWTPVREFVDSVEREQYLVMPIIAGGLFERTHYLMGFEDALCNYLKQPEAMTELVGAIADWKIGHLALIFEHMRPDVVHFHDDWGNKTNLFLPPEVWRKIIKPHHARIVAFVKSHGARFMHHADCICEPVVEDMAEIGIDIWQGVIPQNDIPAIQRRLSGGMALMGGVDAAVIDHPVADEEVIRREVRRCVDTYCPQGHFVPCIPNIVPLYPEVRRVYEDELVSYGRDFFRR